MMTSQNFKRAAIILYFICILGFAGEMDYRDAVFEHEFYIQKVCEGRIIDYKKINPECL